MQRPYKFVWRTLQGYCGDIEWILWGRYIGIVVGTCNVPTNLYGEHCNGIVGMLNGYCGDIEWILWGRYIGIVVGTLHATSLQICMANVEWVLWEC